MYESRLAPKNDILRKYVSYYLMYFYGTLKWNDLA